MKKFILLFLLLPGSFVWAQPGSLDVTFGQSGVVLQSFIPTRDGFGEMAIAADSSIYVMGNSNFTYDFLLAKFTSSGVLDSSFSEDGWLLLDYAGSTDQGKAIAIQDDGKILLGGGVVVANRDWGVVRVSAQGVPDSTFGENGWAVFDWGGFDEVYDIVVQPDGKILVSGGGNFNFALARLEATGVLDSTFGVNGRVSYTSGGTAMIALAADGSVLCADGFDNGLNTQYGVIKFTDLGQIDDSFGDNGIFLSDVTNIAGEPFIALQAGGEIVFGGTLYNNQGSATGVALARILSNGSPDLSFSGDGKTIVNSGGDAQDIGLLPNGHILIAGSATPNGNADMALYCFRSDGTLENTFGTNGTATVHIGGLGEWAYSLAIQPDGKIILGGNHYDNYNLIALVRLEGGELTNGIGSQINPYHFELFPNPTYGQVHIRSGQVFSEVVQITLIDISGKKLWSSELLPGYLDKEITFPEDLPAGLYRIAFIINGKMQAQALMIR
ncbi:MAG: hypothetical protein SF052_27265 [Bacteroidia bacterium]|nr:hypothetical protein [Bacteroidia bacterium]